MNEQTDTPLAQELASLEPLSSLGETYLESLAEASEEHWVFAGSSIFDFRADPDQSVFLLNGDAHIDLANNQQLSMKGRECQLPLRPNLACANVQSIQAETDCRVLAIHSQRLDQLLSWSQISDYLQTQIAYQTDLDADAEWMMTILRSNLFHKVPPTNAGKIFDRLIPMNVEKGEVILRQGELGDGCYFIKEGEADVLRRNDSGGQTLVATIGVGRCFGEDALVNETVRNATVTMTSEGTLMRLEKRDFLELMREPDVTEVALDQCAETDVFIDVRTPAEYAQGHLRNAVNLPLALLGLQVRQLDSGCRYTIYCDSGRRSRAVTHLLAEQGWQVRWLAGGLTGLSVAERLSGLSQSDYLLREGKVVSAA